jgi:hypothetical protein
MKLTIHAHIIEKFKMSGILLLVFYASTNNDVSCRPTRDWAYCDMTPESRNSGARIKLISKQRLGKHVLRQRIRKQQSKYC